jgi:hypothetical protein
VLELELGKRIEKAGKKMAASLPQQIVLLLPQQNMTALSLVQGVTSVISSQEELSVYMISISTDPWSEHRDTSICTNTHRCQAVRTIL